jgi:hypothetical protein
MKTNQGDNFDGADAFLVIIVSLGRAMRGKRRQIVQLILIVVTSEISNQTTKSSQQV